MALVEERQQRLTARLVRVVTRIPDERQETAGGFAAVARPEEGAGQVERALLVAVGKMPVQRYQRCVALAALTTLPPQWEQAADVPVGSDRLVVEPRHDVAGLGLVVAMVDEERCHQQVALGTVGRDEEGDQARGVAVLLVIFGAEPRPDGEGAVALIVARPEEGQETVQSVAVVAAAAEVEGKDVGASVSRFPIARIEGKQDPCGHARTINHEVRPEHARALARAPEVVVEVEQRHPARLDRVAAVPEIGQDKASLQAGRRIQAARGEANRVLRWSRR